MRAGDLDILLSDPAGQPRHMRHTRNSLILADCALVLYR